VSGVSGVWSLVAPAISAVTDLVLPICCVSCDRLLRQDEKGVVCGHCWSRCRELPNPRCDRCGHPVDRYSCRWCENLPPFVRAARSYCWVGAGTGTAIVHALKYSGWLRAAPAMAERMSRVAFPADVVRERAAIIPVPLSRSRLRDRGFNQCEVIARHMSKLWGIPVNSAALVRASATRSQTELTPGERLSNVAGAFSVPQNAARALLGEHVILLDDVITTGATLRACAGALFDAGARTISYMTFGRAPSSGDRLTP
jgi:ComF family protein